MPRKQAIKLGEANIHLQSNWMHNLPQKFFVVLINGYESIFFFTQKGSECLFARASKAYFLVSFLIEFSLNSPGVGRGLPCIPCPCAWMTHLLWVLWSYMYHHAIGMIALWCWVRATFLNNFLSNECLSQYNELRSRYYLVTLCQRIKLLKWQ